MVRVFPLPAPAMTRAGPSPRVTTARCSSFKSRWKSMRPFWALADADAWRRYFFTGASVIRRAMAAGNREIEAREGFDRAMEEGFRRYCRAAPEVASFA